MHLLTAPWCQCLCIFIIICIQFQECVKLNVRFVFFPPLNFFFTAASVQFTINHLISTTRRSHKAVTLVRQTIRGNCLEPLLHVLLKDRHFHPIIASREQTARYDFINILSQSHTYWHTF